MDSYSWKHRVAPHWNAGPKGLAISSVLLIVGFLVLYFGISSPKANDYWFYSYPFFFFGGIILLKSYRYYKNYRTPVEYVVNSDSVTANFTKKTLKLAWEDIVGWIPYPVVANSYYDRVKNKDIVTNTIAELGKKYVDNPGFVVIKGQKNQIILMCSDNVFNKLIEILNLYTKPIDLNTYWKK